MNNAINELARSVVDKNSIHECSVTELEEITRKYPYFGPAQFLLAKKLQQENSPGYERQSQKAILFFQDHLWFDYLFSNDEITGTISAGSYPEPVVEKTIAPAEPAEPAEPAPQPPAPAIIEEKVIAPEPEKIITEPKTEPPIIVEEEEIEPVVSDKIYSEMNVGSSVHTTGTSNETVESLAERIKSTVEAITVPPKEPAIAETPKEIQKTVNEPVKENPVVVTSHNDQESEDDEDDIAVTDPGPPIRFPEFKIEPVDLSKPITFEPFHTVDYFASQGIQVKDDTKPKDRFTQQLRSFTEWLKTMKKLSETEIALPPPVAEDQRVTQMAESSLSDRNVVTEAMAEVWEKQGNHAKAIEVYGKLSLLNPDKSSYFAAKIEHLKRQ